MAQTPKLPSALLARSLFPFHVQARVAAPNHAQQRRLSGRCLIRQALHTDTLASPGQRSGLQQGQSHTLLRGLSVLPILLRKLSASNQVEPQGPALQE